MKKNKERRYKKVNVSKTKKRFLNVLLLIFSILFLFLIFRKTGAIFQTKTDSKAKIDIAFYCIDEDYQTMNLNLDNIEPRVAPYQYNFSVSNNNGTKRTETELTYDLSVRTTTNLPLEITLYDTNSGLNIIGNQDIDDDEYGTYFRKITIPQREFGFINNQTDNYRLEIVFPSIYNLEAYHNIIELVEINVDSKQKI